MRKLEWQQIIQASADPQRAKHGFDQLKATNAAGPLRQASPEEARILAALFSGSQALGQLLLKHPDWLPQTLDAELLRHPRQEQGLRREVDGWLGQLLTSRDYATALTRLRQFKQREMLRIAARDLARLGNTTEITREISDVADVCLDAVYQVCGRQFTERFGQPYHPDSEGYWQPTEFCVFGMGKLGGQELNYSSDVDLIFLYTEEGYVFKERPTRVQQSSKGLANHQFFKRLIEAFVAEITRMTPEGTFFRIDLRLRPEGDAGPLARSLSSYENYYAQWGQTWERMMLIKARRVAGDPSLASEFFEMVQPFRYPRSLGERILREVAGTKQRIEDKVVKAGEVDRNVKLGRGGIREIEFIAQTLQLLNGGRIPFLQNAQTLPALEKLVQYHLLPDAEARKLADAYCFLRDLEHRLQMDNNLQTHTIPTERKARERLAALMGVCWPAIRSQTWKNRFVCSRPSRSARVMFTSRRARPTWRCNCCQNFSRSARRKIPAGKSQCRKTRSPTPTASWSGWTTLSPPTARAQCSTRHGSAIRPYSSCCCSCSTARSSSLKSPSAPPTWWMNWNSAAACAAARPPRNS